MIEKGARKPRIAKRSVRIIQGNRGSQGNVGRSIIDEDRQHANLSSVIRLYVVDYYRRVAEVLKDKKITSED